MEKREEIKNGVKQRLIEFMADQITKEESFTTLKSELIEELLVKKEIEAPIQENLADILENSVETLSRTADYEDAIHPLNETEAKYKSMHGFVFNKEVAEKRMESLKKERQEQLKNIPNLFEKMNVEENNASTINNFFPKFLKKMNVAEKKNAPAINDFFNDVKQGKLKPSLKGFLQDFDQSPDVAEIAKNLGTHRAIDKDVFTDYELKYDYRENDKDNFRKEILEYIKSNKAKFSSETFDNKLNYYKKFSLSYSPVITEKEKSSIAKHIISENIITGIATREEFKLNISFVYNHNTNCYFIDNFDAMINSRYIKGKDLGLMFAVAILTIMRQLEIQGDEKISKEVFKESKRKTNRTRNKPKQVMDFKKRKISENRTRKAKVKKTK